MWTRNLLKTNAKTVLSRTYWQSFLVSFLFMVISGGVFTSSYSANTASSASNAIGSSVAGIGTAVIAALGGVLLVGGLLGLAYSVFIVMPIAVGEKRYFMEARGGKAPIGSLFSTIGKPNYLNIAKTSFFQSLYIFLWSLLFIIPGIIKSYQYYMVPYILAERPDMDTKRALELSRIMTDGEKWNIFVLQLSFWGWYILGTLCFGIGVFFVAPYEKATFAELYTALRTKAIDSGSTNTEELPGFIAYD